ncbi:DUF5906 domain-containing protein [Methylocapsa palsarum]|uniref:RepB DNA-primase n=1 Tax=Methylocapsa palsarum TaxID=1612308 RepID=A0A1I3W756_9HYPH|nr:DUF5906 domain-containing protein [Methylocapsa palsarum]SFK03250.1 RepB DNA-primase [Methylocapsa palsarum]
MLEETASDACSLTDSAVPSAPRLESFDRAEAERFLHWLDPSMDQFTFQTFDDSAKKDKRLAHVLNGSLDQHWGKLFALSRKGAGVFVTINRTDLKGRKTENIIGVRALFVDLDDAPASDLKRLKYLPLRIHLTSEAVSNGAGKLPRVHAFWKVEGVELDEFATIQDKLARIVGGDVAVKDLPRVMRLPGFPNNKRTPQTLVRNVTPNILARNATAIPKLAFFTAVEEAFSREGFSCLERAERGPVLTFSQGAPDEAMRRLAARTQRIFEDAIDPTARELLPLVADMLRYVSSDLPRTEWWPHLAAMAHLAGGSDEARSEAEAVCREWSSGYAADGAKSTRYAGSTLFDEADFNAQWSSCIARTSVGEPATWRSIRRAALSGGWTAPQTSYSTFAKAGSSKRDPDIVDLLNERWAWLEDEQVIFDLKFLTTRTRDQMMGDTAALFTTEEASSGRMKRVSGYNLWFVASNRRTFAGRRFLPGHGPFVDKDAEGKPLGGVYVNLWQGWGCEPVKGDVGPLKALISRLCGGDEEEIRYLTWRIAVKLQKPWVKIPSYVLIVTSQEGTGKSQLGKFIVGLYGKHGKIITDRELESSFDDWKADGILFAMSEEVSLKEKKSTANRLKAMTSMEVQHINPKGKPSYSTENYLDLYFTANDFDALYIRNDKERRPFITHHSVEPMPMQEAAALQKWYNAGGKEAMLFYFLHEVDGRTFNIYAPAPSTSGKTLMAEASRSPAETFVAELLADAAEDAAEGKGVALRDFSALLTAYAGMGAAIDKRAEKYLAMALTKAGVPRRRVRVARSGGAQKSLYAVLEPTKWVLARNEEWVSEFDASAKASEGRN